MTNEEVNREAIKVHMENKSYCEKAIKKNKDLLTKYDSMLSDVYAWTPPTEDHNGLKTFMIDQIKESIRFDCSIEYYIEKQLISPLSGIEWREQEKLKAIHNIQYHEKEYALEVQRCTDRTNWIKALRISL